MWGSAPHPGSVARGGPMPRAAPRSAPHPGSVARGGPMPRAAPRGRAGARRFLWGSAPHPGSCFFRRGCAPNPTPTLRGDPAAPLPAGGARRCAPFPMGLRPTPRLVLLPSGLRPEPHADAPRGPQQPGARPRVAPRTAMRRATKARRGSIQAVCDREATPVDRMQRRSNAAGLWLRAASPTPRRRGAQVHAVMPCASYLL